MGSSLVAESRGYSSLWCAGLSVQWLRLLWKRNIFLKNKIDKERKKEGRKERRIRMGSLALLQRACVRAVMDTGCRAGGGVWKAVLAA